MVLCCGDGLPRCLFVQAEDGIRDVAVTGVQTCALPISTVSANLYDHARDDLVMFYFRDGANYADRKSVV